MDDRVRLTARRGSVSQAFTLSVVLAQEKARQLRSAGWEVDIVPALPESADVPRLGEPIHLSPDGQSTQPDDEASRAGPAKAVG